MAMMSTYADNDDAACGIGDDDAAAEVWKGMTMTLSVMVMLMIMMMMNVTMVEHVELTLKLIMIQFTGEDDNKHLHVCHYIDDEGV
jgi:uncharacterized membrane-anchored protein